MEQGGACGGKASRQGCRAGAGRPEGSRLVGPRPCGRRQLPLCAEGRGPCASEACTRQGSPVADSQTQAESCRPAKQPSGPAGYAGPGAAAGAPAPRRQSSRPRSLFPFQLSANLPVKSSNYDDCPSAKSRENYKLLQNPPC